MNRLHPTGGQILVEEYSDIQEGLVIPDRVKGKLFRVLDVGQGWYTEHGVLISLESKVGDIAAIEGKILSIPFQGERYVIAREADVIAYFREGIDIPDKI